MRELRSAAGDVVAGGVTENVGEGVGFGDVLCRFAEDHGEFGLVVAAVVELR